MASVGATSDAARADVRALIAQRGHATDNARTVAARLERAFGDGALVRTPILEQALGDLKLALGQADGERPGGKSAEASRLILRVIDRALDEA